MATETQAPKLLTGQQRNKLKGFIQAALIEHGRESESDFVLAQHVNAVANAPDLWQDLMGSQAKVKELAEAYVLFYDQFKTDEGNRSNVSDWARAAAIATLRDEEPPQPPRADAPDDIEALDEAPAASNGKSEPDPQPEQPPRDDTAQDTSEDKEVAEAAGRKKATITGTMFQGGCARLWRKIGNEDVELFITAETDIAALIANVQQVIERTEMAGWIEQKNGKFNPGDIVTMNIRSMDYLPEKGKDGLRDVLSLWDTSEAKKFPELRIVRADEIAAIGEMLGMELQSGNSYDGPFEVDVKLGDLRDGKDGQYANHYWRDVVAVRKV